MAGQIRCRPTFSHPQNFRYSSKKINVDVLSRENPSLRGRIMYAPRVASAHGADLILIVLLTRPMVSIIMEPWKMLVN